MWCLGRGAAVGPVLVGARCEELHWLQRTRRLTPSGESNCFGFPETQQIWALNQLWSCGRNLDVGNKGKQRMKNPFCIQ